MHYTWVDIVLRLITFNNTSSQLMIHHAVNLESFKKQLLSKHEKIQFFTINHQILMYT